MTLVRDIIGSGLIIATIVVFQYLMIRMVGPSTQLHELASGADNFNGSKHADFWFRIIVVYLPLVGYTVAIAFPFVRNYRSSLSGGIR